MFTYDLTVASISNQQGSLGGSLSLVINGLGFSSQTRVTICNNVCNLIQNSINSITCSVPAASNQKQDTTCSVAITQNSITKTSSFLYSLALTPIVLSVSPVRGGTGGGTLLTINGTNFPYLFLI